MNEIVRNSFESVKKQRTVEEYLNQNNVSLQNLRIKDVYRFFRIAPSEEMEVKFFSLCKTALIGNIQTLLLFNPEMIKDIFAELDLTSSHAIEDVQTFKEFVTAIHNSEIVFSSVFGKTSPIINELNNLVSRKLAQMDTLLEQPKTNFFAAKELKQYLEDCQANNGENYFYQQANIFEIFPGVTAMNDPGEIEDEDIFVFEGKEESSEVIKANGVRIESYFAEYGIDSIEDIFRFKRFIKSPYKRIFEEEFKIELKQLSPIEQIYVVKLISNLRVKDLPSLKKFILTYELNGLRVLMSSEFKTDIFDIGSLVDLANHASDILLEYGTVKFVQRLFDKYYEIISQTERIEDFIFKNHIGRLNRGEKTILQKSIRKKSSEILLNAIQHIVNIAEQSTFSAKYFEFPEDILTEYLNKIQSENILLGQFFVYLKTSNLIKSLSELSELKLSSGDFDKTKVEKLYKENYQKERAESLFDKMLNDSKKPGFKSFCLEYSGELVGFVYSIEDEIAKSVYIGGLNTSQKEGLQSLQSGGYLMNLLEDRYYKSGWYIEAVATSRLAAMYIDRRGFYGSQILSISENGEFRFQLKKVPQDKKVVFQEGQDIIIEINNENVEQLNQLLNAGYLISKISVVSNTTKCTFKKIIKTS